MTSMLLNSLLQYFIQRALGPLLETSSSSSTSPFQVQTSSNNQHIEFTLRNIRLSAEEVTKCLPASIAAVNVKRVVVDSITVRVKSVTSCQLLVVVNGVRVWVCTKDVDGDVHGQEEEEEDLVMSDSERRKVKEEDDRNEDGDGESSSAEGVYFGSSLDFLNSFGEVGFSPFGGSDEGNDEYKEEDVKNDKGSGSGWIGNWIQRAIEAMEVCVNDVQLRVYASSSLSSPSPSTCLILRLRKIIVGSAHRVDNSTATISDQIHQEENLKRIEISGFCVDALDGSDETTLVRIQGRISGALRTCESLSNNESEGQSSISQKDMEMFIDVIDGDLNASNLQILSQVLQDFLYAMRLNCEEELTSNVQPASKDRPVVGGMLLHTSTDDDQPSYLEAFYDATDQSISKYISFVGAATNQSDSNFSIHMSEVNFRLSLEVTESTSEAEDYVYATLSDTSITLASSLSRQSIHFEVSRCSVHATLNEILDEVNDQSRYHVVRFINNDLTCVVPPSHISFTMLTSRRLRRNEDTCSSSNTNFDISLEPVEIVIHPRTLKQVQTVLMDKSVSPKTIESQSHDDQASVQTSEILFQCAQVSVFLPVWSEVDDSPRSPRNLRNGVECDHLFTSLGLSMESCSFQSKQCSQEMFLVSHGCKIFFVSKDGMKYEFAEIASEPELESESGIRISYIPAEMSASTFPNVPTFARSTTADREGSNGIRPRDPQEGMLKEVLQCVYTIEARIPFFVIDLTLSERSYLEAMISSICTSTFGKSDTGCETLSVEEICGFALRCDQCILMLHEKEDDDSTKKERNSQCTPSSYITILDGFRTHVCRSSMRGLTQIRATSQDITLYEASYVYEEDNIKAPLNDLKRRGIRSISDSVPIFYRTKLGSMRAIEKPAFHCDVSFGDSDDFSRDKIVFLFLFDMTYRYSIESAWFFKYIAILQGYRFDQENKAEEKKEANEEENDETADRSLTKIFITVWDAILDYTPPEENFADARVILRLGEVHSSTNMVSGSPFLTFKVCLSDMTGYLSNLRISYGIEDHRMSCGLAFLGVTNVEDSHIGKQNGRGCTSISEAITSMGLVQVISLDTIDSFVKFNRETITNENPRINVNLYLGLLSIHTCKDSFKTLTKTFGEFWTEFTAPDEEELRRIKETGGFCEEGNNILSGAEDEEINLLENITTDMFSQNVDRPVTSTSSQSNIMPDNADDPPDNELSASELRQKYNVGKDVDDLAKSMLIPDFYTVKTCPKDENAKKPSSTPLTSGVELGVHHCVPDDWASIGNEWVRHDSHEDQQAMWFTTLQGNDPLRPKASNIDIYPTHVPISSAICDPLGDGDMDAGLHAGTPSPSVNMRLVVHDLSACFRFFDGIDFFSSNENQADCSNEKRSKSSASNRREELMNALLDDQYITHSEDKYQPLINDDFFMVGSSRKSRDVGRYFETILDRVRLRMDSFVDVAEHRLTSCLDVKISGLFLSETISRGFPKKMMGEWINDHLHPRDNNDGFLMMKMVSMQPAIRISMDGKLMSDETRVALQFLPIRVNLDQHALTFIKGFFSSDDNSQEEDKDDIPGTFFQVFDVKPCKLKVNYQPIGVDYNALRNGSYLELLNLFPLEDMDLILKQLSIEGLTGWGNIISEIIRRWIEDISSGQIHKFVTRAAPVNVFTNLGNGAANLVLLPVDQYRKERKFVRGVRDGASSFAKTVALETINATSKISKQVAKVLDTPKALPHRPGVPKNVREASAHSRNSVAQGFGLAARTIVAVPCNEYRANGATGAIKGVAKALPIAVMAPLSGASEALSYTLQGARNQLRPDLYQEEEMMARRHNYYR